MIEYYVKYVTGENVKVDTAIRHSYAKMSKLITHYGRNIKIERIYYINKDTNEIRDIYGSSIIDKK